MGSWESGKGSREGGSLEGGKVGRWEGVGFGW